MKLIAALVSLTAMAAAAQTAHTPAHRAASPSPSHSAASCAKIPEVSTKIPALPASFTCAKILYTLRVEPPVKIAYVSPLEGTALEDTLGLGDESFSLMYVDTKVGTGPVAQAKKWYSIRYTGYLPDGTIFDSNVDKPDQPAFSFPYGAHRVINGWDTGFAGMRVGGKRRLFIPYQLAYGANGSAPRIPPKTMLIFDVEFLGQTDTEPIAPPPASSQQVPPAGTQQGAPASRTAPNSVPQSAPGAAPASGSVPGASTPKPQ